MDTSHGANDPIQSNEPIFGARIDSGLTTPTLMTHPNNSASNQTSRSDIGLDAELSFQDKLRRFREYLDFSGIITRPVSLETSKGVVDDDFYNDEDHQASIDIVYNKCNKEVRKDYQCSDAVVNAYDQYDLKVQRSFANIYPAESSCSKFSDSLILKNKPKERKLSELCSLPIYPFRNNIAEDWNDYDYIACGSVIVVYENSKYLYQFDTRPAFTSTQHIDIDIPTIHGINFLKVSKLNGKFVLITCGDDGRVLVYELCKDEKPKLSVEIQMTESVWGVDSQGKYLVVSDNSRTITLFIIENNLIHFQTTHHLLHNIPDLKIFHVESEYVIVNCISISGEVVTFEFSIMKDTGETSHKNVEDEVLKLNVMSDVCPSGYYKEVCVKNRAVLNENGWTINKIPESYFKEIDDVHELGQGDLDIRDILEKSRILKLNKNHIVTSDVGGASKFETLVIRTANTIAPNETLFDFTQNLNKIKNSFLRNTRKFENYGYNLDDTFVLVTTQKKLGLFSAVDLICTSYSLTLFDDTSELHFDYFNRISITRLIPDLSACVVLSQSGWFSIFRFVKYRGIYTMREEFTESLITESIADAATGCFVRKASESDELAYTITFVMSSHNRIVYTIRESDFNEKLIVDALI